MTYRNVILYGKPHERAIIKEGVIIGDGTRIGERSYIGKNARIGENCRILYEVTICKDAVIGDNVFIGPNVSFFNDKFPPTHISQPPIVENDVIICGLSAILPGVTLKKGCVIGAGAVITKDVPTETVIITESKQKAVMTRREYDRKQSELKERFK